MNKITFIFPSEVNTEKYADIQSMVTSDVFFLTQEEHIYLRIFNYILCVQI